MPLCRSTDRLASTCCDIFDISDGTPAIATQTDDQVVRGLSGAATQTLVTAASASQWCPAAVPADVHGPPVLLVDAAYAAARGSPKSVDGEYFSGQLAPHHHLLAPPSAAPFIAALRTTAQTALPPAAHDTKLQTAEEAKTGCLPRPPGAPTVAAPSAALAPEPAQRLHDAMHSLHGVVSPAAVPNNHINQPENRGLAMALCQSAQIYMQSA